MATIRFFGIHLLILCFCTFPCFAKKQKHSSVQNLSPVVVSHPSELSYKPLDWHVPKPDEFKTHLVHNIRLYIAQDNKLPLVQMQIVFQSGTVNDPDTKTGLTSLLCRSMRTGGTKKFDSDAMDALIDRFALSFTIQPQTNQILVQCSFLSQFTDTAFILLEQMLFNPLFEDKKLEQEKGIMIQRIEHQFDNPGPILSTAFTKVMYPGEKNSTLASEKSIRQLTRQDMISMHKNIFITANALVSIAGDFNKDTMVQKLNTLFAGAPADVNKTAFPKIEATSEHEICIVHKQISQAYVRIGLPLFQRPNADYYAISVFNQILGGDGFLSRLGSSIRSDQGLTYSISSDAESNYFFPGLFSIGFFTKSASVNHAIALTLREVKKIITEPVTDQELKNAQKNLIDEMPSLFRSKRDIVNLYGMNEYLGRSDDHFATYADSIGSVTSSKILSVAKTYIKPEKFTFVIVGDTAEIFKAPAYDSFALREIKHIRIISPDMLYTEDFKTQKKP